MDDTLPIRTVVDDLLDEFVVACTPDYHRALGAPAVTVEVRKTDLRGAAEALLKKHAAYIEHATSPGLQALQAENERLQTELDALLFDQQKKDASPDPATGAGADAGPSVPEEPATTSPRTRSKKS